MRGGPRDGGKLNDSAQSAVVHCCRCMAVKFFWRQNVVAIPCILILAWLRPSEKHMTTGRINQNDLTASCRERPNTHWGMMASPVAP